MDNIKNLYRTYKNMGIKMEGMDFGDDGSDNLGTLSHGMLPTIKYSQVQKTTTTILPPLP